MYTTLATVQIGDVQRFLEVFSSAGLQARQLHGSLGAQAFAVSGDPGRAMVLIDWGSREQFDAFRADPAVRETMKSGGATAPPVFTALSRLGSFPA